VESIERDLTAHGWAGQPTAGRCRTGQRRRGAETYTAFRPCTFLNIRNGRWTGFWENKNAALSTNPQVGFLDGSQNLWVLWATASSEFYREASRLPQLQLGRFAGSAFLALALRVAWGGPAPRRGWSLMHIQWGVAP